MAAVYENYPQTEAFNAPRPRPSPQVIEIMLDELEDKVRHYFRLYTREKKLRAKSERYNYWLQTELAQQKEALIYKDDYINNLERKFQELRGTPEELKETIQRIDLVYVHLDTLIQALAGVCGYIAVKDATKDQLLQCALDYLYPCRALDPRLHQLYGALYYFRLGDRTQLPATVEPPPSPWPEFVPPGAMWSPWLPPGVYPPFKPSMPLSPLEKGIEETKAAIAKEAAEKDAAAAKAKEPAAAEKPAGKPAVGFVARKFGKAAAAAPAAAKPAPPGKVEQTKKVEAAAAEKKPAAEAAPEKKVAAAEAAPEKKVAAAEAAPEKKVAAAAAAKAGPLEGVELQVKCIKDFKRPASSKVQSLRVACRLEGESAADIKKKEGRFKAIEKMEGSAGNESATLDLDVTFKSIPPRRGGLPQKFIIDIYDDKGFSALGKAEKLFTDPDTLKEDAAWEVKDSGGKVIDITLYGCVQLEKSSRQRKMLYEVWGGVLSFAAEAKAPEKEAKAAAPAAEKPGAKVDVGKKEPSKLAALREKFGAGKPAAAKDAATTKAGVVEAKKPAVLEPKKPAGLEPKKPALAAAKGAVESPKKLGGPPEEIKKPEIKKVEIKKPELQVKKPALDIKKPDLPGIKKLPLPKAGEEGPVKPPLKPPLKPLGMEKPSLDTLKKPEAPKVSLEKKVGEDALKKLPGLEIKKPEPGGVGAAVTAPPKKPPLPGAPIKPLGLPKESVEMKKLGGKVEIRIPEAAAEKKAVPGKALAPAGAAAKEIVKPGLKEAPSPMKPKIPGKAEAAAAPPAKPAKAAEPAKPGPQPLKPGLKKPAEAEVPGKAITPGEKGKPQVPIKPGAKPAAPEQPGKAAPTAGPAKLEKKVLAKKYHPSPAKAKDKAPPKPLTPGALAKKNATDKAAPAPMKPPAPKPAAAAAKDKAAAPAAAKAKPAGAAVAAKEKALSEEPPIQKKGAPAPATPAATKTKAANAPAPAAAAKGKAPVAIKPTAPMKPGAAPASAKQVRC